MWGRGIAARLWIAALLVSSSAIGAHAAAKDDINGVWVVRPDYYLGTPLSPAPVLTSAAGDQQRRRAAASAKGYVRSVGNMLCEGGGGAALMMIRSPFEVYSGFGRITFIFETETFNQPRTIYLNEKSQPENIFPSRNGHSIGRWEGDVLVIDTIGYDDRGALVGGVPRSGKAHTVERFSLSPDGKVLSDQVTSEDPVTLQAPWTTTLKFDRVADTEERFEVTCDVDLDAFKTLDLLSLKDADPEVARLLDPDQRGTDPALKIAQPPKK